MLETMVLSAKLTTLCLLHSAMVRIQLNTVILCGAMFQLNALLSMLLFPLSHSSLLLEFTSVIRLVVKNHSISNVMFLHTQMLLFVKLRLLKPLPKLMPPLLPLLELKLRLMLLLHRLMLKLPSRLLQMLEQLLPLKLPQRLKKKP